MNFKNKFKESFEYLKSSLNYIYAVFFLFILGSLIGFIFAGSFGFLDSILDDLVSQTTGKGFVSLSLFIFQNNTLSSLSGLFFGVFLGLLPIFSSIFNGILLGYVYSLASSVSGFSVIWQLIPHGVFELPAVFISLGLGLKLGFSVFQGSIQLIKDRFRMSFWVFVLWVIPLLLVAAIIEGGLITLAG